jgi:hypothetical protein
MNLTIEKLPIDKLFSLIDFLGVFVGALGGALAAVRDTRYKQLARSLCRLENLPHRRDHGFRLLQRAAVAGAGNTDRLGAANARCQAF